MAEPRDAEPRSRRVPEKLRVRYFRRKVCHGRTKATARRYRIEHRSYVAVHGQRVVELTALPLRRRLDPHETVAGRAFAERTTAERQGHGGGKQQQYPTAPRGSPYPPS